MICGCFWICNTRRAQILVEEIISWNIKFLDWPVKMCNFEFIMMLDV